jgi:hypothetical protein
MLRLLGSPRACARCARGHPLPAGRFPGGHCCSGSTLVLFSVDEVAALKLAGTRPGRLEVPRTEQCGCAFRGPTGCSLDPADRPSICARYVCLALRQELTRAGAWLLVAEVGRALRDCFAAFVADRGSVMVAPCG